MSPQRRRSRALVIDDSLVVRKSISMALKRFGFDVTVASDGLEGLNAMKQTTFDLVLCDFLMPVMDGLDCTKQYREWEAEVSNPPPSLALPLLSAPRPPGYRQLIVGMSAHGAEQVASQGLVAGMDDFLPKPIGVPTLKELVESSKVRDMSNVLDSIEAAHDALQTPALDSDVVENDSGGVSSPLHTGSTGEFARRVSSSLEHVSTVNHSDIALTDPPARQPLKRPRSDADNSMSEPHCLIATHQPEPWIAAVTASIESQGWKTTVVHAPASALRMLQSRNWDLVLICEEPFRTGGGSEVPEESPVSQFRSWERHNRINLQKNVCWLTDLDLPSRRDPASCMVLAPRGYDHVLRKPVLWDDLRLLLGTHRTDSTMSIVVNK
jgi:CheY-like chemotaxis protein